MDEASVDGAAVGEAKVVETTVVDTGVVETLVVCSTVVMGVAVHENRNSMRCMRQTNSFLPLLMVIPFYLLRVLVPNLVSPLVIFYYLVLLARLAPKALGQRDTHRKCGLASSGVLVPAT